jgi:hypothetical protein
LEINVIGSITSRNINKKTLRPLIKKESLERMSLSIAKKRMFPQSKSKQQLLSNLEKLKKFKPLIKQSMDVFEKPRKSLKKQKIEIPEMRLRQNSFGDLDQEVISEEGASNYNTRNSYDDFMEIEKKIRKSVQIENLKGLVSGKSPKPQGKNKNKKKIEKIIDEEDYVSREKFIK